MPNNQLLLKIRTSYHECRDLIKLYEPNNYDGYLTMKGS